MGFDVSNCGYHRLADELRSGVTDAAFLLVDCIGAADLHTTILRIEPLVFATSPRSGLAKRTSLTIGDLEGHILLLPKHDCGYRMELERVLKEAHVQLATLIELNCLPAMIRCLTEGLGVALLPRVAVEQELKEKQLVALDWKDAMESRLLLLRHRDKPLQGVFGAFIKAVEDHFTALARPRGTHAPPGEPPARRVNNAGVYPGGDLLADSPDALAERHGRSRRPVQWNERFHGQVSAMTHA